MGKCLTASARGDRRYGWIGVRGLWLVALTILGLIALPAAAAQADSTWSGASTTSQDWSDGLNWVGNVAPVPATAGTLTFPDLTCGTGAACMVSHNDLSGVMATGLVFSNTSGQYRILGNSLSVGTGGITDTSGGTTSAGGPGDVINAPLTLSAAQTWHIGNGFGMAYNSLSLPAGGVTGSGFSLGVTFAANPGTAMTGDLFVGSDMEVGAVTVNGHGGLHVGPAPGSVNGTNGHGVTLNTGATLIANPGATVGALTMTSGSKLLLGTGSGNTGTTTLGIHGTSSALDLGSTMQTYINDNGSTPGTSFSQLSSDGNINLAGTLDVGQGQSGGVCAALSRGDVATLITTTGSISGTFSNAAPGAILSMSGGTCSGAQVQISYTTNSVIATIVSGTTPTSTSVVNASPSPASTNQAVNLTATVTTNTNGNVAPSGTVAFSNKGSAIPGCTAQPVTATGSSATATCTTSFAAGSSPESLTAAFTGASGSGQNASSSPSAQSLTVNQASTSTKLAASNTSPAAGGSVTYTATVTPGVSGAFKPGGTVKFLDDGSAISACTAQPLSADGTATCTVSYPASGSHSITATYNGDSSFSPSTSGSTTVTVTSNGGPPPPPTKGSLRGGPGGRLIVIGRTIQFTEKCQSSAACNGSFTLTVTVRGRHHKLTTVRCASGSFKIAANKSGKIRVKLSGACMRMLRTRKAHHRLKVLYVSKSQTGQKGQRYLVTLVLR